MPLHWMHPRPVLIPAGALAAMRVTERSCVCDKIFGTGHMRAFLAWPRPLTSHSSFQERKRKSASAEAQPEPSVGGEDDSTNVLDYNCKQP